MPSINDVFWGCISVYSTKSMWSNVFQTNLASGLREQITHINYNERVYRCQQGHRGSMQNKSADSSTNAAIINIIRYVASHNTLYEKGWMYSYDNTAMGELISNSEISLKKLLPFFFNRFQTLFSIITARTYIFLIYRVPGETKSLHRFLNLSDCNLAVKFNFSITFIHSSLLGASIFSHFLVMAFLLTTNIVLNIYLSLKFVITCQM